ncbi:MULTISPECIES: TraV family lipoprotein [Piscinibacter]|uniref:TraV family lipoprotein n=1 Tax=Piscinibacter TaxID=1114981 RepID=UPI000FDE2F37|nr:TraV family lipoprotein [Piscinibacter defluvii]
MSRIAISKLLVLAPIAVLVQGCAITGLDGGSKYSCKAPEGVHCDSVSGTYYNAIQNNLPSQRRAPSAPAADLAPQPAPPGAAARSAPVMLNTAARTAPTEEGTPYNAAPLRAAPRVLRLWVKSWEDADRDLVGESLVYVQVDNGRWLVDHVQRQQRDAFAPVRAPKVPTGGGGAKSAAATPAGPAGQVPNPGDDSTSITQALRALQGRAQANQDQ